MFATGLKAAESARAEGLEPSEALPAVSKPDIKHTLRLARDAARMAELAAELAAGAASPEPSVTASRLPSLPPRGLRLSPALPGAALHWLDWAGAAIAAEAAARWSLGAGVGSLTLAEAAVYLGGAAMLKLGLWTTGAHRGPASDLRADHAMGGLALGTVAGLIFAVLAAPDQRTAAALSVALPAAALALALLHAGAAYLAARMHRRGLFAENIAIVGATAQARAFAKSCKENGSARIVAVIDDRAASSKRRAVGVRVLGGVDDLLNWPSLPQVDRIVIALPSRAEARIQELVARLKSAPNRIDLALGAGGASAIIRVSGVDHCHRRAFAKRAFDLCVGAALLALFAAPMLAIALAVKLDGGPVLFRQPRQGFNNRVFTLVKFRTLRRGSQEPTKVGGFLRRTSLDELPQLFNVLAGEMSLVGPRPHQPSSTASGRAFGDIVAGYARRHQVKPGVTGLAQINGCRGAVRTAAALRRRLKFDLEYVERASIALDVAILFKTAAIVAGDVRRAIFGR